MALSQKLPRSEKRERLSEEEKVYLQYQIYNFRYDDPWIADKRVAKLIHRSISTVNRYARKAEEREILCSPRLYLSYPERRAALLLFEDKSKAYNELQEYDNVISLGIFQGNWDIMAVYDGYIDFLGVQGYEGKVVEGLLGRIFSQKVPYVSWEKCLERIEKFLKKKRREKSNISSELCIPEWNDEEWRMFHYFRTDLRKNFTDLRKVCPISWRKYEEWKGSLSRYCTTLSCYYPEGHKTYDSLTLCFRTEYEHYVVQLFSMLPTSSVFYKIGEYFGVNIYVPRDDTVQMRIYDIVSCLLEHQIIVDYLDGKSVTKWGSK